MKCKESPYLILRFAVKQLRWRPCALPGTQTTDQGNGIRDLEMAAHEYKGTKVIQEDNPQPVMLGSPKSMAKNKPQLNKLTQNMSQI
jgi:hypothetical protein